MKKINPENIIIEAAHYFNVNEAYLYKNERTRSRVQLRSMVFKAIRELSKISYLQIAAMFNKDHSTIIHGIRRLNELMSVYPDIKDEYENFINHLNVKINDLHFSDNCCPNCGRYNLVTGNRREGRRTKGPVNEEAAPGTIATL